MSEFAADLAGFLAALHEVDPSGGPLPGTHNFFRSLITATPGEARKASAGGAKPRSRSES
ncbi:MAG TPA: hypothetical protein VHT26_15705 [Trebonia sp.]|nr:hypothetical protein [Trebonia sp.]